MATYAPAQKADASRRQIIRHSQPRDPHAGKPDAVFSCVQGTNADLIANVVRLYVRHGDRILDTTFGKGTFWAKCDRRFFRLVTADLARPADCKCDFRHLPFQDAIFDHTVFDPPYVHDGRSVIVGDQYNNGVTTGTLNHNQIIAMYDMGIQECARVTKDGGLIWVKCQDEVENHCQRLSHVEIINRALRRRLYVRDLFVLLQAGAPILQHRQQQHARKNHSHLLLLQTGAVSQWARQTALTRTRTSPSTPAS